MKLTCGRAACAAVLFSGGLAQGAALEQVDGERGELPKYEKVEGLELKGTLDSVGSDTMINLMTYWAEGFARYYPGVKLQVEGKGSSTAPPALIEGTAHFGPMSRAMKATEIDEFEKALGYKPTCLRTCLDALAVFVNKDNPIESLSLEEVDAVFSKTRNRGFAEEVTTWGQLGLAGEWANQPISAFGRNSASGTYGYFKETVLEKGDYKDTVKEQPGSSAVVQGVAESRGGIGYSGIGYATSDVRAVPLSARKGKEAFAANIENVLNEDYPLGRYLFLYVNRAPGKALDPMVREFLKFVYSREGQQVVEKAGYLPLSADVCRAERELLD
ncbi:MAG: PstS family phosphate ABC transporter substrate-binding protein [Planctomycetes bacterium]|nr:PstS family phosphate ABC transporter substrate-binding protein [Planctomycetota bacterium]